MSCLFQSFSVAVAPDTTELIRQKICNHLASTEWKDQEGAEFWISWLEDNLTLPAYVARMRLPSSMGGALEIQCFAQLYRYRVIVQSLPNQRNIEFIPFDGIYFKTLTISWNGGHYEFVSRSDP